MTKEITKTSAVGWTEQPLTRAWVNIYRDPNGNYVAGNMYETKKAAKEAVYSRENSNPCITLYPSKKAIYLDTVEVCFNPLELSNADKIRKFH